MATKTQIEAIIDANVSTNANNENTGALVNAALKAILNDSYNLPPTPTTSFPVYSALVNYTGPVVVFYNDRIYRALKSNGPATTIVTPGTDPLTWFEIPSTELAHAQNTDIGLGRYEAILEGSGTKTLTTNQAKNLFRLDPGAETGELSVSLQSDDSAGVTYNYMFVTYVPDTATGYTVSFENDTNQQVGDSKLVLGAGEYALWMGNFNGKTTLLATTKTLIEDAESITEVSTDVTPDIDETDTLSTVEVGSTSATIAGGPYTEDELAGKYLIVTHDDLTGISRTPITAHLISANTTDGIVTFSPAIQYAGDPSYQVVTPYAATIDEQDNIIAANASDNLVITVPAITATDNRASLTIYREGGNDPDSEHTVFIAMQNNVLGTPNVTLINDYELIQLRAHTSGSFHWDFLGSNRLCVSLNVSITTPDVTPLSNTTDETIKGTAWELNHPSRWIVEVQSDDSVELIYNSRIKRNLLVTAVVEVVRDSLSPEITISAQVDTGAGWTLIDSQEIPLTNTSDKAGRTFIISQCFEFGDKIRFVSKTDTGTYHIKDLRIKMAYPNG